MKDKQEDQITQARQFLKKFFKKSSKEPKGSVNEFMEITMANMISLTLTNVARDASGKMNGMKFMTIAISSYQEVIDNLIADMEKTNK